MRRIPRTTTLLAVAFSVIATAAAGFAAEPKVVVTGLDNPCGLAIQPGSGDVFIATHAGVLRFQPSSNKVTVEISGYPNPTDIYGKGPKYPVGPLGLAFVGDQHLVVGDGSRVDGEEFVRVYKVGHTAPAQPLAEADAAHTLGPITAGEHSAKGEGNFYGVAANGNTVFVTCNGDDTKGWVAKIDIAEDGKPGKLIPTIATKEATNVDAPVPIAFTPNGKGLAVGQMGEITVPGDSLFTIYNPATGKLRRSLKTGLHDVAGLAYSPTTRRVYVTDFAWLDAKQGGLFQLVGLREAKEEVKTKKICSLDKPTAVAFDTEGNAYVAVFGTQAEGSTQPAGQLVRISAADLK